MLNRLLITGAAGEDLSVEELAAVQGHAKVIADNWEKVLAEAIFKYAGSVYKDIAKLEEAEGDEAKAKAYATYAKHWGELKGFTMAIQSGKNNLGATAVEMNRLVGFGPVTMDNSYVTGVDANGDFVKERRLTWSDFRLNMLKVQQLMVKEFGVQARANDATGDLAALVDKLESDSNAETD